MNINLKQKEENANIKPTKPTKPTKNTKTRNQKTPKENTQKSIKIEQNFNQSLHRIIISNHNTTQQNHNVSVSNL